MHAKVNLKTILYKLPFLRPVFLVIFLNFEINALHKEN